MERLSKYLEGVLFLSKICGVWPGKNMTTFYKFYATVFLIVFFVLLNAVFTVNLIYTPRKIELLAQGLFFCLTAVTNTSKIYMLLKKRVKILELFDKLDIETFKGNDEDTKLLVQQNTKKFSYIWKTYVAFCHISYFNLAVLPVFKHIVFGHSLELPNGPCYFLSDKTNEKYFKYLYFYQAFSYTHMVYNVYTDCFIAGLIYMGTTQLKVVNYKMINLKLKGEDEKQPKVIQEELLSLKLVDSLYHYELILNYCAGVQEVISATIFWQFTVAATIIGVELCALTMSATSTEFKMFAATYLVVLVGEIFTFARLGTDLSDEHENLMVSAYHSDWIGRPKKFVSGLQFFIGRPYTPLMLNGMKIFPLTMNTFLSIIKTAYSFFTLMQNVQHRDNKLR